MRSRSGRRARRPSRLRSRPAHGPTPTPPRLAARRRAAGRAGRTRPGRRPRPYAAGATTTGTALISRPRPPPAPSSPEFRLAAHDGRSPATRPTPLRPPPPRRRAAPGASGRPPSGPPPSVVPRLPGTTPPVSRPGRQPRAPGSSRASGPPCPPARLPGVKLSPRSPRRARPMPGSAPPPVLQPAGNWRLGAPHHPCQPPAPNSRHHLAAARPPPTPARLPAVRHAPLSAPVPPPHPGRPPVSPMRPAPCTAGRPGVLAPAEPALHPGARRPYGGLSPCSRCSALGWGGVSRCAARSNASG